MLDAHDPRQDDRTGGEQAGHRRRGDAGGEQHHHRNQDDNCLAGARPHGHRLTTHQFRRIDDQDIRILEPVVESFPCSLQKHRVASLQHDTSCISRCVGGGKLGIGTLHRKDDQVAALGDHAGENVLAYKAGARRDHHLGEARTAIEQRLLSLPWRRQLAECEVFVGTECGGRLGVAPQQQVIALGDSGSAQRAGRFTLLNGDELQVGIGGQLDRRSGDAYEGRSCAHAHLVDAAGKAVLLDERLRMAAEVGRHGRAIAFGQESVSEQYDDRHRAGQQRQPDKREFEEAEAAEARVGRSFRDQNVHRCTGQGEHRAGMCGKDKWHKQLRRIPLQPDGDDDHHRQKRGDGAVDADQRGEQGDHDPSSAAGGAYGFLRRRRGSGVARPMR